MIVKYYSEIEELKDKVFDTKDKLLEAEANYYKDKVAKEKEEEFSNKEKDRLTNLLKAAYEDVVNAEEDRDKVINEDIVQLNDDMEVDLNDIREEYRIKKDELLLKANKKVKIARENKDKLLSEYCEKFGAFTVEGEEAEKYFDSSSIIKWLSELWGL